VIATPAYEHLHRLIRRFSNPEHPQATLEEMNEWFGLKYFIRESLRKPYVERPADDPTYGA
jgi:hypothetical protein